MTNYDLTNYDFLYDLHRQTRRTRLPGILLHQRQGATGGDVRTQTSRENRAAGPFRPAQVSCVLRLPVGVKGRAAGRLLQADVRRRRTGLTLPIAIRGLGIGPQGHRQPADRGRYAQARHHRRIPLPRQIRQRAALHHPEPVGSHAETRKSYAGALRQRHELHRKGDPLRTVPPVRTRDRYPQSTPHAVLGRRRILPTLLPCGQGTHLRRARRYSALSGPVRSRRIRQGQHQTPPAAPGNGLVQRNRVPHASGIPGTGHLQHHPAGRGSGRHAAQRHRTADHASATGGEHLSEEPDRSEHPGARVPRRR